MPQRDFLRCKFLELSIKVFELLHTRGAVPSINRVELSLFFAHPVPDRFGPSEFQRVSRVIRA